MDIVIEEAGGNLWVAATESGRLQGLEIDPPDEAVRWGAIYYGRVTRIDRAADAAFIDLGGGDEGILYNRDVRGGNPGESVGKRLRPGQMVAVQAKTTHLKREEDFDFAREDKNAVLSMDITVQGRFLVYAPFMDGNRISSRIQGKKLREQLTSMLDGFAPLTGLILRAASEDTQSGILLREAKILTEKWASLAGLLTGDKPRLLMEGPDALMRVLSDQAGRVIERIETSTQDRSAQALEWCKSFAPDLLPKVEEVAIEDGEIDLALFEHLGLIGDIEELFQDYALLPSGGNIIIQDTAALIAIDVNRGADDRPVRDVNLEAGQEIARQIRLRNLGGIILVDFLKLSDEKDRKSFLKDLAASFNGDPCTVQIHGFTALGLLEITRKRRTAPLSARLDSVDGIVSI